MSTPRWLCRAATLTVLGVVAILNLLPLEPAASLQDVLAELGRGWTLRSEDSVSASLAQRLLLFLPLGLLIHGCFARQSQRPVLLTLALMSAIALMNELLQAVLSYRHALLVDLLLVIAIGLMAGLLGEVIARFNDARRRALSRLYLLGQTASLVAMLLTFNGASLDEWDCSYPLLIGNEGTGDRPWLGAIQGVAVYPHALPDDIVTGLAAGFGARVATDLRADQTAGLLLDFNGREAAGTIRPKGLVLRQGDPDALQRLPDGGMAITAPAVIEITETDQALCETIRANGQFTLETTFKTSSLDQKGPARLITMSPNTGWRNMMLGQQGDQLVLRVRNVRNGVNGTNIDLFTAPGTVTGEWQHVVARYDHGDTQIFLDGMPVAPRIDYAATVLLREAYGVSLDVLCGLIAAGLGMVSVLWLWQPSLLRLFPVAILLASVPQIVIVSALAPLIGLTFHISLPVAVMLGSMSGAIIGYLFRSLLGFFKKQPLAA